MVDFLLLLFYIEGENQLSPTVSGRERKRLGADDFTSV